MTSTLIFVFLGCSTELNVIDQKDAVELLQGQHENPNLISNKNCAGHD